MTKVEPEEFRYFEESAAPSSRDVEAMRRDGYVVLEGLLDDSQLEALRCEIEAQLRRTQWGRNEFEGKKTERVYSMLVKCPSVAPLVEHPRVLSIADALLSPSYLLAACQGTRIHPGETAQVLHCDDEIGAAPRPRSSLSVSVMWALSDYTPENGSTLLVPRSHAWKSDRRPDPDEAISLTISPGSALVWLGGVYHGGGANVSNSCRTGVSIIYFEPWLRQVENMTLAVAPDVAASYSERIQRLLGYGVLQGLFFGHVDGRDPIGLVRAAKECDASRRTVRKDSPSGEFQ